MSSGRPAPYPHNKSCRRRMEALIRVDEPARWKKAMLGKGVNPNQRSASESDGDDDRAPSGSACAPEGPTLEEQPIPTRAEYVGFRGPETSLIQVASTETSEG